MEEAIVRKTVLYIIQNANLDFMPLGAAFADQALQIVVLSVSTEELTSLVPRRSLLETLSVWSAQLDKFTMLVFAIRVARRAILE
jgi:hypothetical protein